ncbi:MAG: DUF2142 domain-containing protein [Cellulomonadaceae bacterium]|nr:DUF2142 domain-containing protein [Cellulomonadaceae bacterium]
MEQEPTRKPTGPARNLSSVLASPSRTYWSAFVLLSALMGLWAVANPPMASPDEPAHVIKAAAVVRGQLTGVPDPGGPGSATVEVPALYAYSLSVPSCYVLQTNVTAECIPDAPADLEAPTRAATWVVRNNPLYYAIVGLPTLLPASHFSFYLMRLVSALLTASVLAWAFRGFSEIKGRRFVGLGLLAATTPMVLFLGSTVNSSALEISAALALWTSLLVVLRAPDPARLTGRMAGIAVLAVLLANSRGLAPVFLGVIVITAVAVSPWHSFVAVVRDRRSWPWLAVAAMGFFASLAWIGLAGTLESGGNSGPGVSFAAGLKASVAQTPSYITGMLGHFGWLDTALPQWLYLWLAVAIGVTPVIAVLVAQTRKDQLAVLGVGALALALPVLIQAWQAKNVGVIWQGRYSMPLMVGLPVVAGFVLRSGAPRVSDLRARPLFLTTASLLAIGHVAAFWVNLHRYVRGTAAPWFGSAATDWAPPVPTPVLLLGFALAVVATVALIDVVSRSEERETAPEALTEDGQGPRQTAEVAS